MGNYIFWSLAFFISSAGTVPVCDKTYDYVEVPEDSDVGHVITNISCSGQPGSLTYAISKGNTQGKFALNSTNNVGYLYVYQSLSFETRTTKFQLTIEVSENGPVRSSTWYMLDLQITGINTYAPLFLFSPYTVYINENIRPGSIISTPIPYDFDKGEDGHTTSVILDGDDGDLFYMEPATAKVYLRSELDYERKKDYVLTIQVTDFGLPERKSSTTVLNIHVKDVNDNAPVCTDTYITETFPESKYEGSLIRFLKCRDDDEGSNGRLTYTIVEGDYTKFRFQGSYLILSQAIDVDVEPNVWPLSVRVKDRGNPRLSTLVEIVLYVEGVDDNTPEWAAPEYGNYTSYIEENSPVGTHVVHVSAHDADTAGSTDSVVIYYMDAYSDIFTIKPTTGDIYLSREIDREMSSSYIIPVSAVSHNNPQDRISTTVIVNVIDVNDNAPEFEKDVYQFRVAEDADTDTVIVTVQAKDPDDGDNGLVSHRILNGDPDHIFDMNAETGAIRLTGKLDYEITPAYTLFIQATDRGRPARWTTSTAVISIQSINEFEPIFQDLSFVSVSEDTDIGTSIFEIHATDADSGWDGEIVYQLQTFTEIFIIESRTGVVRTVGLLDKEKVPQYGLEILAVDQSEANQKTGSVKVELQVTDVNDNPPVCDMSYTIRLSPPVNSGDKIQSLHCTDADQGPNSKLSYTISSGNTNNDFAVNSDGQLVVLRKPTTAQYRLEVLVSDSGSPSLHTNLLVFVETGSRPILKNLPNTISVSEGAKVGAVIFTVEVISVSGRLRYSIESVTTTEVNPNPLAERRGPLTKIDEFSGAVYLWQKLNREQRQQHVLKVTIEDLVSGLLESSQIEMIVTDLNDNEPKFESSIYNISIVENINPMTVLLTLRATDEDQDENGQIVYFISNGNEKNLFQISSSGVITTASVIDREVNDMFFLEVEAVDQGKDVQLTGTTTVLVSVIDADEFPPEFIALGFDLETSLYENTPLGALVFQMEARDLDVESNIHYSLDKASQNHFIIDNLNGDIFLSRFLDRETVPLLYVVGTAKNNHGIETSATVTLKVLDVNDNDPAFVSNVFTFDVDEKASVGQLVGHVSCTDADIDANGMISMSITRGNIGNAFRMEGQKLRTNIPLRYDNINEYLLEIEARDGGTPRRMSVATVIVQIKPEVRPPKFAMDLQMLRIPENTHLGNMLYNVDATLAGAREGVSGDIYYSIESGNMDNIFAINKHTGEVTLANVLDRDDHYDSFVLKILAVNRHNPMINDVLSLKLGIDDVNDLAPVFSSATYKFNVDEDSEKGFVIGKVSAIDLDVGINAAVGYDVLKDMSGLSFDIDKNTGTITLNTQLDYHTRSEYQFTVLAFDHGSPAQTGTAFVHVDVNDINNKAPEFENPSLIVTIPENTEVGRTIFHVQATDEDTGKGGIIHFEFLTGNDLKNFQLDSQSGALKIVNTVDREEVNSFDLEILAKDGGEPQQSSTARIHITVKDVNDNDPQFSQNEYSASVSRFSSIGTFLATVTASDIDEGMNAEVQYFIKHQEQEVFQIDLNSGHMSTFSDLSEMDNSVIITVIALDRGRPRRSSTASVMVDLFPPRTLEISDFTFNVSEFSLPNALVGNIHQGNKGSLSYVVRRGNYKNGFRVGLHDGSLHQNGILDREEYSEYYLLIEISDQRRPGFHQYLNVHIRITDENDNFPVFSQEVYHVTVLEHTPVGYIVGEVLATDQDAGSNGEVSYYIMPGSNSVQHFDVSNNGSIAVSQNLHFVVGSLVKFVVLAKDRGHISRQATAIVQVTIVNLHGTFTASTGPASSGCISVEVPNTAAMGHKVTVLRPEHFKVNFSSDDFSYISQGSTGQFHIDKTSGKVTFRDFHILPSMTSPTLLWVVARSRQGHESSLALLRIDNFSPADHVAVLSHEVSVEYLETKRSEIITVLSTLFPGGRPVVWKIESEAAPSRRRLLLSRSKAFVYVIRNSSVDTLGGLQSKKEYYTKEELIDILHNSDGTVTSSLTTGAMETYPVNEVIPYRSSDGYQPDWIHSVVGKVVLSLAIIAVVAVLIASVIYWEYNKRKRKIAVKKNRAMSLNIPPLSTEIARSRCYNCNNIKTTAASAEALPLINALKILSGLTEQEREKLIQQTFRSHKQADKENLQKTIKNVNSLNNMRSVILTTDDEVGPGRKGLQKNQDQKQMPVTSSQYHMESTAPSSSSSSSSCLSVSSTDNTNDKNHRTYLGPQKEKLSVTIPDDQSLSSLELETDTVDETASESKVMVTTQMEVKGKPSERNVNHPIIIGGKEYDGVGKDTASNKKYMYNTRTGDKIEVTDDVFKRAIQQRQSVMNPDFKPDNKPERKISTLKNPMRRKTSRTRFSTTTIWEMSVDEDSETENEVFKATEPETSSNRTTAEEGDVKLKRSRKFGMDFTKEQSSLSKESTKTSLKKQNTSTMKENTQSGFSIRFQEEKPVSKLHIQDGESESYTEKVIENNDDEIFKKINIQENWDKVLDKTVSSDVLKQRNKKKVSDALNESKVGNTDAWSKAHNVVRFVRPVYKPLNLEGVTCKVPKGRSDPKDCLSKDPVYAGWAKLVGRRMTRKVNKKKGEPDKMVTVREGRSLPANLALAAAVDVVSYTKNVSGRLPPHLQKKRMSIDIKT